MSAYFYHIILHFFYYFMEVLIFNYLRFVNSYQALGFVHILPVIAAVYKLLHRLGIMH